MEMKHFVQFSDECALFSHVAKVILKPFEWDDEFKILVLILCLT